MKTLPNRTGYRGYICARQSSDRSVPQHIQQLVMRDYCAKRGMIFLLSATEYRMPGCTMMLDAVMDELDRLQGIVLYSMFLLPTRQDKRLKLYTRVLEKGATLHLAAEGIALTCQTDIARLEDTCLVQEVLAEQTPGIFTYLTEWDQDAGN